MKRHCPVFDNRATGSALDYLCTRCGRDPLDPVHWPPKGVKERILDFLGLLR